jgi:hypothetical protein
VVPNAVKFEVVHEAAHGHHKDVTVVGFFTKDETTVWFRDFRGIIARNAQRTAVHAKNRDQTQQIKHRQCLKTVEPDSVGRCAVFNSHKYACWNLALCTMHNSALAHSNASVHTHRTATRLNAFIEELLSPVTVEKNELEEKQQFVKRKLQHLLLDKVAFVECLDTGDKMQKRLLHRSSKIILPPPTSSHELTEEDKIKKAAEAEARYLQVKLDMAMFLELLRKNELCEKYNSPDHHRMQLSLLAMHIHELQASCVFFITEFVPLAIYHACIFLCVRVFVGVYICVYIPAHGRACMHTIFAVGKTGFAEHAVRSAWKAANANDGSENNLSTDKDKLKLDWHEYQTCIRILAKRAGVSLGTDVSVEESDR